MSKGDNNSYSSETEYDEESFDNDSFEEISGDDESISELFSDSQSDDLVLDNTNIKSLTDTVDKLSCGKEEEENEDDEENQIDLSSLSSKNDDNEVLELIENPTNESEINENQTDIIKERNGHEIDESDSDDNESELEIVGNNKSSIQSDKSSSEPLIENINANIKSLSIQTEKTPSRAITPNETQRSENRAVQHDSNEINDIDNSLCTQSEIEFNVTSQTPTSFNSENHAFHMNIFKKKSGLNASIPQRSRNSNRKSLSFSNERMREIERHNQILLRKILTQKPKKDNSISSNITRTTSSAVNRKKQQRQIDLDNQVLKRKIEAISVRRHNNFFP